MAGYKALEKQLKNIQKQQEKTVTVPKSATEEQKQKGGTLLSEYFDEKGVVKNLDAIIEFNNRSKKSYNKNT